MIQDNKFGWENNFWASEKTSCDCLKYQARDFISETRLKFYADASSEVASPDESDDSETGVGALIL